MSCEWQWNMSLLGATLGMGLPHWIFSLTVSAARMSQPGSQSEGSNRASASLQWTCNMSRRWTTNKPLFFQVTEILELLVNEAKPSLYWLDTWCSPVCVFRNPQVASSLKLQHISSSSAHLLCSVIFWDYGHCVCQCFQCLWIEAVWGWLLEFILDDWGLYHHFLILDFNSSSTIFVILFNSP